MTAAGDLDRERIRRIVAGYANIDVPCLIIWGARDSALPISMGYKLMHHIPGAELYILEHCRHSIQIEHPAHCAAVIREFGIAGRLASRTDSAGGRVLASHPE